MVVDDEPGMRPTLEGIMEDEGYDVVGVEDGYHAIELAKTTSFDLIFMDIKMPGINRVDAYREIKKVRPESVVVMMTGFSLEDMVKDALDEGAHAVIYKPFAVEHLLDIMQSVLQTSFVLVVDDWAAEQETLQAVLEESGYYVHRARDGPEAVRMAAERHYGIILMDIKMPGTDGFAAVEEVRKIDPKVKAIFVTGFDLESTAREALLAGAYAVVLKPVDPDELLTLMESLSN